MTRVSELESYRIIFIRDLVTKGKTRIELGQVSMVLLLVASIWSASNVSRKTALSGDSSLREEDLKSKNLNDQLEVL